MKVFDTLAELKLARLATDELAQILNPTIIDGVITNDPLGGILIASGNYFLARQDDLETLSARKSLLLSEGQIIQGYQKDNNGDWQTGNFLTPTLNYGGQIWWPSRSGLPGDKTSETYTIRPENTWGISGDVLTVGAVNPSAGNVQLTYDRNDSLKYAPSEGDGGGGTAIFEVVTSADSPISGQDNSGYLCDTTDGTIIIQLPAGADVNEYVAIGDYNGQIGTNPVTVTTTDGSRIMGLTEDFEINTNYAVYGFSYIDAVVGWKVTTAVGESEAPSAIQDKTRFTGIAGDTELSVPDYDQGYVEVFYNGIRLDETTEYLAITGNTVTLYNPVVDNDDIIEVVSYNHVAVGGGSGGGGTPTYSVVAPGAGDIPIAASSGTLVDLSAGGRKAVLTDSVSPGDWVSIGDYNGSASILNPLVISSVNHLIHESVEDLVITSPNTVLTFSYIDTIVGWKVVHGIGEGGDSGDLPYEEVDIVPTGEYSTLGSYPLPTGYTINDFERIDVSFTRSDFNTELYQASFFKENISVGNSVWVDLRTTQHASLVLVDDNNVEFVRTSGVNGRLVSVTGYTKYKPVLDRGEFPKPWVVIGDSGAPSYVNGGNASGYLRLRYRYEREDEIKVTGSVAGVFNGEVVIFNFPSEITDRINVTQSVGVMGTTTGDVSTLECLSQVFTSGEFLIRDSAVTGSVTRGDINQTILLDVV